MCAFRFWMLNAVLLLLFLLLFLVIIRVLCESFVVYSFSFFAHLTFFPFAFTFFRLRLYISTVRIHIYIFRITFTCKGIHNTQCQCQCVSCAIVTLSDWLANTDSNRLRLADRMWEPHTNCFICLCVVSFRCVCICMWIYLKDYPPISGYTGPTVHLFHIFPYSISICLNVFYAVWISFRFILVYDCYYYYYFFPFLLYFGDLRLLNWVFVEFVSSAVFVFRVRIRFYPTVY